MQLEQWLGVLMSAQGVLYRYKGILAVKDSEKGNFWLILQVGGWCRCRIRFRDSCNML